MQFLKQYFLFFFISVSTFLYSQELSFTNAEIDAGNTANIELLLDNEQPISGFQFQIVDLPNQGLFSDVQPTDRTSSFMVSFNEQPDGSLIVVGFSLTGDSISPGTGAILSLVYQSTGQYTSNISLTFFDEASILSDSVGQPISFSYSAGSIIVNGEEPPPVIAVENLSAVGGFGEVNLSWSDPNTVEISGYHIFRDGSLVGTSTISNYTDVGLQQATEHCYTVTAFNENSESDNSSEVCATTTEIYLEEPSNLTAIENGLEVSLEWEIPSSAIGVGDECVTDTGVAGYLDCSGICFDQGLADVWIGDGFCDGLDANWGVNFSCSEWDCDGCDCAGTGNNSDECIESCGSVLSNNNNPNISPDSKEMAQTSYVGLRDLIGYEVYRNNELIDYITDTEYLDTNEGLWYLEDFCYNVTADYDEGASGFSNTACVQPQLNPPSALSAQGTGSFITLNWLSTPSNDQSSYNIYRDDQLIANVNDIFYEDNNTIIGEEYCYFIKAQYDGIGESPQTNVSCTSWNVYPPSHVNAIAGDQFVDLTWEEPTGGEEYALQYDDGVLANAFYFNGTYEDGLAHGMRFDVGVDFDVLAASVKILSEGDAFWPWPNETHAPVRVLIFDDNNGTPGSLLYESEAVAEDGWATVYPNINGLSGSFYVLASYSASSTDYEGFGVDATVDYADNMVTLYYGEWNSGDVLGYGGDYMMASQILAYGNIETLSFSSTTPDYINQNIDDVVSSVHDGNHYGMLGLETHPEYNDFSISRDLQSYDIYRDNNFLTNLAPNIFSYRDEPVSNMIEYCYTLKSNYDEGASEFSEPICVMPYPGPPASDLLTTDLGGTIGLDWMAAPIDPLFEIEGDNLIDYQVYRDGINIGSATTNSFIDDSEIVAGVQYCYEVKANYPSGETFPTNTACAVYYLSPPVGVNAVGDDQEQYITVSWSAPGSFVLYNANCDGGSFQTEVAWQLEYDSEIILTGGAPYSENEIPLFYGDYILNMQDSWGDGWNGNIWSLVDQDNNLVASCTLDTGTEGMCEFSLGRESNLNGISPAIGIDNAPDNKEDLVALDQEENSSNINNTRNDNHSSQILTRDMLAYHIYRDGQFLVETDLNTFLYIDDNTAHDVEYCYTVKTVYDDGDSVDSNESCDQWVLLPPTDFYASGMNGRVELQWTAANSNDVIGYNINRDGNFLTFTNEDFYYDETAIHNTEYCYTIEAVYDLGSSAISDASCAMWEILPPGGLIAEGGDGMVHLEWSEPSTAACADEVIPSLPFNALGSNAGAGDDWLVQGAQGADYAYRLSVGSPMVIDITLCSANTTYDTKLEIFTADQECIETTTGYYIDDATCEFNGLQSTLTGVSLDPGQYYIVVDGYGGGEGQYEINVTQSALNAIDPNDVSDNILYESEKSGIHFSEEDWSIADEYNEIVRELVGFNIYKNGNFLTQVGPNEFEYDDYNVTNLIEYCYTVSGVYQVGESDASNIACATPIPGQAPTDLFAFGESGAINLEWVGGSNGFIDYNIYRDGVLYDISSINSFIDNNAEHDRDYCYVVSANYPSGESDYSNQSCAMWVLAAPLSITAMGGNGFIQLDWTEPGVATCADEVIPSLPFNTIGTNEGAGDEWLVQGSQGADYAYLLVVSNPIVIDVTLCSANTTFDTKLEIFTADQECIETTTGYYIDDATCEFSSLQSTLTGVSLDTGQYYIVVDGYSGQEGQYEINVTQSALDGVSPNDISYNIMHESTKSGIHFSEEDWSMADDSSVINRDLIGFSIFRDNSLIDSVGPNVFTYLDLNLENGTTYCYYVLANYDEGDSQPTPTVCAAPDAGPMCPPENLVLSIPDGSTDIDLLWDFPNPNCQDQGNSRIDGFNIYKDDVFIQWVVTEVNTFTDTDIVFGQEYCYKVKAVYEDGESNPSNSECGSVINPGDFSIVNMGNVFTTSGQNALVDIDINNQFSLAGFQFWIEDAPDLLEALSVSTTDRSDGFMIEFNEQPDGSIIIVGFNITGGVIDIGTGSILNIEYSTPSVVEPTEVSINVLEFYLGDSMGYQIPAFANSGSVNITVEGGGCTDSTACNYNAEALFEDGSCEYDSCVGCTDSSAFNFNEEATIDNGLCIYDQIIIGDFSVNPGDIIEIPISLSNQNEIAGFQFTLSDNPDLLSYLSVTNSDRTETWLVNGSEVNNNIIVLGFDFQGSVIETGEGPIAYLNVQANTLGEAELLLSSVVLSGADGNPIYTSNINGSINVSDEEPNIDWIIHVGGTSNTFNPQHLDIQVGETVQWLNIGGFHNVNGSVDTYPSNPESFSSGAPSNDAWSYVYTFTTEGVYDYQCDPHVGMEMIGSISVSNGYDIEQSIILEPYTLNNVSFNVYQEDASLTSYLSNIDLFLGVNGSSEFYVPSFGVNQIGDVDIEEGYKLFINGAENQEIVILGSPALVNDHVINLSPFSMNLISYLPQECIATDIVFDGYQDEIFLVKNSNGYYIPSFNVMTLTEMCPGEAYGVFLSGASGIDFTYPMGGALGRNTSHAAIESYKLATRTDNVNVTGESHLFIIEGIDGAKVGDQLRAYDNEDKLVGSINIVQEHLNESHVIDLVIHKMVDLGQYGGPVLDGCSNSVVSLKLYNAADGNEYNVSTDNNGSCSNSDADELSELGRATVGAEDVEVTSLNLDQNYPNPFNPTTTINFNVHMDGGVTLKIYDITGRLVRTLVNNEFKSAGNTRGYDVMWDGTDNFGSSVSAGLYLYTLQTADMSVTKKMIYMK